MKLKFKGNNMRQPKEITWSKRYLGKTARTMINKENTKKDLELNQKIPENILHENNGCQPPKNKITPKTE